MNQSRNTQAMLAPANKDSNKQWRCRWATPQDQSALLALFESAFGHAMPESLWRWKYAWQQEPGMLAYKADSVIAYYGSIPRLFSVNGTTVTTAAICDVMVAPEMRGILTRKGPFMQTADAFLSERVGPGKPFRFAFGFPSHRHARLGEKSGWYTRSDTFTEISWTTRSAWPPVSFSIKMKSLTVDDAAMINTLWHSMQSSLPHHLIPQKHADFFQWRYLNHPVHTYLSYGVFSRWKNKPLGILVLRDQGDSEGMELLDLLGPPNALPWLFKAALTIAGRSGRHRLYSWMTSAIAQHLPKPSTTKEVSGVYVTPDYQQLIEEQSLTWWLMGGDTDFH